MLRFYFKYNASWFDHKVTLWIWFSLCISSSKV